MTAGQFEPGLARIDEEEVLMLAFAVTAGERWRVTAGNKAVSGWRAAAVRR